MTPFLGAAAFDRRPIVIAIAGPNGAGKTTFFRAHLEALGLRYVNADDLARELETDAYEAAELAAHVRAALIEEKESFVFETVFSDPAGEKLAFLSGAAARGFTVVLCFVGLEDVELSEARVAQRVLRGGHDVPTEKLRARFPRTLRNLARAVRELPHVLVYDNSTRADPFRVVAEFEQGKPVTVKEPVPAWAARCLLQER
jgi:predicted ABC-type ATPase